MNEEDARQFEKQEILRRYRGLLRAARKSRDKQDRKLIRKAFDLALDAHKDMRRKSGEPYIYHPIAVAQICAEEIGLGTTSIVCALLHDTVEDTTVTLEEIRHGFGEKVAQIIDGLTKISGVFDQSNHSVQAENFRKMILTLSEDIRVILIKLADRLHNMRTLDSMSRKNQVKISSETIYVYAPLAHRLGLYNIKTELEDLALKFTEPERYFEIVQKLQETKHQRNKYIRSFIDPLESGLNRIGFPYEIKGRPKSIHSILNKMKKQGIPFEEVFDLFAIRIILDVPLEDEKMACWRVFAMITEQYHQNPDRMRDWISNPKTNGYESLHVTVMGPKGRWVEVQIRTQRMNEVAEKGLAAHWKYKSGEQSTRDMGLDQWLGMVRELLENPEANAVDFLDEFKLNLYSEEVFVFTPKGELRKLPMKATALDFAFDIHSDLGSKCIGAKVNNKLVPLSHHLSNGDQVEIITSKKQKVHEEWLRFVVTAKAKSKIKSLLKDDKKEKGREGKEWLERKFKQLNLPFNSDNLNVLTNYYQFPTSLDLFIAFSTEELDKSRLDLKQVFFAAPHVKELLKPSSATLAAPSPKAKVRKADIVLFGDKMEEMDYGFTKCCQPIPGDSIIGFITIGEGIKVHQTSCPNAIKLSAQYGYRIIKAQWANDSNRKQVVFPAAIKVSGIDDVGVISKITDAISKQLQINMKSIIVESHAGTFEGKIVLYITDTSHLDSLIATIKEAVPFIEVSRTLTIEE